MKECRHSNISLLYIEPRTGWQQSFNIWSVTVGPVRPDIYPYSFNVDGVTVMDPANEDFFPNERFKASLVDVPGFTPLIHALREVPHGSVNRCRWTYLDEL